MKKDVLITFILFILITFVQVYNIYILPFYKNKLYEKYLVREFIIYFQKSSTLLLSSYEFDKNIFKTNTDLKHFIKTNKDYDFLFNLRERSINKKLYKFFNNQVNINLINRTPDFKDIKIFETFNKNISVSINFYKDKKNKKIIVFIKNELGEFYGKNNKNIKSIYNFSFDSKYKELHESYLKI